MALLLLFAGFAEGDNFLVDFGFGVGEDDGSYGWFDGEPSLFLFELLLPRLPLLVPEPDAIGGESLTLPWAPVILSAFFLGVKRLRLTVLVFEVESLS